MTDRVCVVEGCDRTYHCRGYCKAHYQYFRNHRDPDKVMKPIQARAKNGELPHGTASGYNYWGCRCEECTKKHREYHREYQRRRPDTQRTKHLRWAYGIELADYERMVAEQANKCAICGQEPKEGAKLYVDHCHDSKRVRALLCQLCNVGLGSFGDDPVRLLAAAEYLFLQAERVVA